MQKSESIGELAKALALAQGEIKGAVKDSENPFFKSKYADLASVRDACQQALSKNGLAIVQVPGTLITEHATIVSIETLLMHSSGEWVSGDLSAIPVKDDPQGLGSCITYLRRYALSAYTGVAPEDDDGNAASQGNGQGRPTVTGKGWVGPTHSAPKSTPGPKPTPNVNAEEVTQIKKALVDTCKLLNAAGDKPLWGAKRLDGFAVNEYGVKADDLELEPLRELLKKLSLKLDAIKQVPNDNPTEIERQAMIAKIVNGFVDNDIQIALKDMAKREKRDFVPTLEMLSLDQLIELNDSIIPF